MIKTEYDRQEELILEGLPASSGIAIGPAYVYQHANIQVSPRKIKKEQISEEIRDFEEVRKTTANELSRMSQFSQSDPFNETRSIIGAQIEIINDPELNESVQKFIERNKYPADYAVCEAFKRYLSLIESSGNKILIERIIDIQDIRDRIVRRLQHKGHYSSLEERSIIVSEEFTPMEIIEFSRSNVLAVASNSGGMTAHSTIIANAMGIPSVIGTKNVTRSVKNGEKIIVDGTRGRIIIRPSEDTLAKYQRYLRQLEKKQKELEKIISLPSVTKSGETFVLRANIEFEEEFVNIARYRADGIGLLRTESLFIANGNYVDGDTQELFYEKSVKIAGDQPVTIRLFDVGGDKLINESHFEPNPFLGWRGVRVLLDKKDLLHDQLCAILKVAGRNPGRIKILVPMVSSLEELMEIKKEIQFIQNKLAEDVFPIDKNIEIGIMIEVPSVAIQANDFAKHVDFFSVGTNDLTQYTLAVDRGNDLISRLYQQMHPSIWRLIRMTADAARKYERGISVCGELASNPFGSICLMGMGISELSMVPTAIPRVKKELLNHTLEEMKILAGRVENAISNTEIMKIMKDWNT